MKKVLVVLLALVATVVVAACGSSSDSGSGEDQDYTSASFGKTLDAVTSEVGENAELLEVDVNGGGTDYQIRSGESATGLHFAVGSDKGEDRDVELIGSGSIDDTAFPISDVDPAAIDKIIDAAPGVLGIDDFDPTSMQFGRQLSFETGEPVWTVTGDGGGRTALVVTADADGGNVRAPGGSVPTSTGSSTTDTGDTGTTGTDTSGGVAPVNPDTGAPSSATGGADTAAAIEKCIKDAGSDPVKAQACITDTIPGQ